MTRCSLLAAALVFVWHGEYLARGAEEYPVPPPPLSEDYYPCADNCHRDLETDPNKRVLEEEHEDIKLHHAEQFRWCLDCHDTKNRDKLHLQSGEKLDFSESYRLCGQCHGDKYRDWRRGIHGKRTGLWNGRKQYLLCAHCHNPHNPKFVLRADPEIPGTVDGKPMPPPAVPGGKTLPSHASKGHAESEVHGEAKDH
jgi:hypothetical protein